MSTKHDPYAKVKIPRWINVGPLLPEGKPFIRRVRNVNDDTTAVGKLIPKGLRGDRRKRFWAEVIETHNLTGRQGVLPVVDFDRDHDDEPQWYVTPEAEMLMDRAKVAATLQQVVSWVASLASALENLAREGVYHRDVKPGNLFWYDDNPLLGDFGIAKWPEGPGLTGDREKVGPLSYTAPEMRLAGAAQDQSRADVYSLGKTLFALISGNQYPPEGTHRPDRAEFLFVHQWDPGWGSAAKDLGYIMEEATRFAVSDRLTMLQLRTEPELWLAQHQKPIERRTRPNPWGELRALDSVDLQDLELRLGRALNGIADDLGSRAEAEVPPRLEQPNLFGDYWEHNTGDDPELLDEGEEPGSWFEAEGDVVVTLRTDFGLLVMRGVMLDGEVSVAAEIHDGTEAPVQDWGRTEWTRARLPSTQQEINELVVAITDWLKQKEQGLKGPQAANIVRG